MSDLEYFAARAQAESLLSGLMTDPRVAAIHAKMAAGYEKRLKELSVSEQGDPHPSDSSQTRQPSA